MEESFVSESSVLIRPRKRSEYEASMSVQIFVTSGMELSKSLGFSHALAYVVGILLGSGIFISPGLVARQTNNMGIALVVWIISGAICLFGALCLCELASALRKTGGEYVFIKEAYGDIAGFCLIWAQTFIIFPTGLAVMAVTAGEYCVAPFHDTTDPTGIWIVKSVSMACLCVSLLINCTSTSFIGKTQVFFSVLQIVSLVFFVVLGLWKVAGGNTQNYDSMFTFNSAFDVRSLGLAFYNSLWAFDGWGMICTITEEMHNPDRDLRLAIQVGIPFVTGFYVLINLSFMSVLTHKEIGNSMTVATRFVEKCLGSKVALAVPVVSTLFGFSAMNAILCITSRSLLSASREGQLPEPLSYIHKTRRTPIPALVLQSILTTFWIVTVGDELQSLVTYFSFAVWLTYGFAIFAVVVLRFKKPNMARPIRVWMANPILMTVVSLYLVVSPYVKQPIESTVCLSCLLVAVPVYYLLLGPIGCKCRCIADNKKRVYKRFLSMFNLVPCSFNNNEDDRVSYTIESKTT